MKFFKRSKNINKIIAAKIEIGKSTRFEPLIPSLLDPQ
jgi:hypothetical protein